MTPLLLLLLFSQQVNLTQIFFLTIINFHCIGDVFTENIEITLCSNNKLMINKVDVKFITGKLIKVPIHIVHINVKNVKDYLQKNQKIPVHLQELMLEKKLLEDDELILPLFIERTEVTLSLIVQQSRCFQVSIACTYYYFAVEKIEISETDTIREVKQKIEFMSDFLTDTMEILCEDHKLEDDCLVYEYGITRYDLLIIQKVLMIEIRENDEENTIYRFPIRNKVMTV